MVTVQVVPYSGVYDTVINFIELPFKFSKTLKTNRRISVLLPIVFAPCGLPASYGFVFRDMQKARRLHPRLIPLVLDKKHEK
jgi:hypothetical protein